MDSPSSGLIGEERATPGPPEPIVLDSTSPPSDSLQGTPFFAPQQPFEATPAVEQNTVLKSFFMYTLGLLTPVIVFFLIVFLGEILDDEAYERHEREVEEYEKNYPYHLTLQRNETGVYSSTIDLPDTHELSTCYLERYGGYVGLYDYLPEDIYCRPQIPSENDINGDGMAVWQHVEHSQSSSVAPIIRLTEADYNFQSKELSLSFNYIFSENLSLDIYTLNEQNQFSITSVLGITSDGRNYIFQNPSNSSDEFYMEMELTEPGYFFSAEACDSCTDAPYPYLDQVRFFNTGSGNLIEIGYYDAQSNELSFQPLPTENGEPFPEQLVLVIGVDWAQIALTNNTTWVSTFTELTDFSLSGEMWDYERVNVNHPNFGYRSGYYHPQSSIEFSANVNGTYERTFKFDQTNSLPLIDCKIESSFWPYYYDASQRYPIYCDDAQSITEYEAMIFEDSPFVIDEHVTILNQSWDPENREFHVEFNRTLIIEENDFNAGPFYGQRYSANFAADGPRKNFTATFDEEGDDIDWFWMQFVIPGNTSFSNDGHMFSWSAWCAVIYCEQNLSAPTYSGITITSEVIGGYNMSNQTLWFHPSQPTPPIVKMQISLAPEASMQTLAQLNYGVYLYGDDYVEYVDDHWDRYGSYPSNDLYFFSFILSPFIYIGAIIYSFMRGNKAFAKGLLSFLLVPPAVIFGLGVLFVFIAFLFF